MDINSYIMRKVKRQLVIDEARKSGYRRKNIFDMYLNGNGAYRIKVYLDSIGIKTNANKPFKEMAVRRILKNKVYAGYVTWNNYRRRGTKTIKQNGDNLIIAKGKHEAIVSEDIWNRANEIISNRNTVPVGYKKKITNPLAGLVKCACCGHSMLISSSTYKDEGYVKIIRCKNCNQNRGCKLEVLEKEILESAKFNFI